MNLLLWLSGTILLTLVWIFAYALMSASAQADRAAQRHAQEQLNAKARAERAARYLAYVQAADAARARRDHPGRCECHQDQA